MKKRNTVIMGVCAIGLLFLLPAGYGAVTLPYAQFFDGWSVDGTNWAQTGGGVVTRSETEGISGTPAAVVSNDVLTLYVSGNPQNAWFQIWAKPVAGQNDPGVSGVTGAFYVKTNGHLMVYGDAGWADAGALPSSPSGWYGFVVHVDYSNSKWDVYYGSSYGSPLNKASNMPVSFPSGASNALVSIAVESGGRALLDSVGVSPAGSLAVSGTSPSNVMTTVFAGGAGFAPFSLPVYGDRYLSGGGNTLTNALGDDLKTALGTSDALYVRDPASATPEWAGYNPTIGAWQDDPGYNGTDWNVVEFHPTTEFWYSKAGSSAIGFFAYNTAYSIDGAKQPGAPTYNMTLTLNGTAGGKSGFTPLNMPLNLNNVNDANNPVRDPNAQLTEGDLLYVANPSDPGRFTLYMWNDSTGQWTLFGQVPSSQVPGGASMWVRRQAAASASFGVSL